MSEKIFACEQIPQGWTINDISNNMVYIASDSPIFGYHNIQTISTLLSTTSSVSSNTSDIITSNLKFKFNNSNGSVRIKVPVRMFFNTTVRWGNTLRCIIYINNKQVHEVSVSGPSNENYVNLTYDDIAIFDFNYEKDTEYELGFQFYSSTYSNNTAQFDIKPGIVVCGDLVLQNRLWEQNFE